MSVLAPNVSPQQKSTIVRSDFSRVPSWLRTSFQLASRIAPGLAVAMAQRLFFRPHGRAWKPPEAPASRHLVVGDQRIAAYLWGPQAGPTILLAHGWAGGAAQMAPLARALAAEGHRAVAIDLPGHGSSSGTHTTLPEVVAVLRHVAEEIGPVAGLVGHSFGAVAIMATASTLTPAKVVTIGCPSTLRFIIDSFVAAVGLEGRARPGFIAALERRFGTEFWQQFSPQRLAAHLAAPALVIHDADDTTVPHAQAQALAATSTSARQHTTSGLGHYRVLRSSDVHRAILAFLNHGVSHEPTH